MLRLTERYPDIQVEVSLSSALVDIVSEQFDAGVRLGEQIAKDMIAARIGPDLRMAVVAAPAYLERYGKPEAPHDLTGFRCGNIRLPTAGGVYIWEFEKADDRSTFTSTVRLPSMTWTSLSRQRFTGRS